MLTQAFLRHATVTAVTPIVGPKIIEEALLFTRARQRSAMKALGGGLFKICPLAGTK